MEMYLSQLNYFKEQCLSQQRAFWLLKNRRQLPLKLTLFFDKSWVNVMRFQILFGIQKKVHTTLIITSAGIQNISETEEKGSLKVSLKGFEINVKGKFQ